MNHNRQARVRGQARRTGTYLATVGVRRMDPLIIVLVLLIALLGVAVRMAGAESRRRKRAYAAYFQQPRPYRSRR